MDHDSAGLFIRADASPAIGAGHAMRCLALAQTAWNIGIPVQLAARVDVPWVLDKLKREKLSFLDLQGPVPKQEKPEELLAQIKGVPTRDWVVLDGYHFGIDCQKAVRAAGYKLLVIDDYAHLPEYSCDILLNQNLGAEKFLYAGSIGKALLGPRYALLRPEFLEARKRAGPRRFPEKIRHLLLTLGGGDQSDELLTVAAVLLPFVRVDMKIKVILGGMDKEKASAAFTGYPCPVHLLDAVEDMPSLMRWADFAVTAGGSTCWELCCLGTPFAVHALADNQSQLSECLRGSGGAATLEALPFLLAANGSPALNRHNDVGSVRVDGYGAHRIIQHCLYYAVSLRRADYGDSSFLLDLINNPAIKMFGGNSHIVTEQEHQEWLSARLYSDNAHIFIVRMSDEKKTCGYIRFEYSQEGWVLSIALEPSVQNRGLGSYVIEEGCRKLQKECTTPVRCIMSYVKTNNTRALHVFEKNGFVEKSYKDIRGNSGLVELKLTP